MKKKRWGFIIVPWSATRFVVAEGATFTDALLEASRHAGHDHLFYKMPLVGNMIHITDFDRKHAARNRSRFQAVVGSKYEADGYEV